MTGAATTALPLPCRVEYHPRFLAGDEADELLRWLDGVEPLRERTMRGHDGREIAVDLGTGLFADPDLLDHWRLPPVWGWRQAWPALLAPIRTRVEAMAGRSFPVARCIYYESGEIGLDYHVDLPAYGPTDVIASLSLGAERTFALRRRGDPAEVHRLTLAHGSLVVMGEGCQDLYEHALLVDDAATERRFNLTFRRFDR